MTSQNRSALTRKLGREFDELVLARILTTGLKSGLRFARGVSPAIRESSQCAIGALALSFGGYVGEEDSHSFARAAAGLGMPDAYIAGINDGFEGQRLALTGTSGAPITINIRKHGGHVMYARGWAIGAAVASDTDGAS